MKRCSIAISFLIGLFVITSCKKTPPSLSQGSSEILIGEVETLTGSEAAFGTAIHHGIELITRQINDKGGIRGKKIRIITLDDQGKSDEAATAATKLITQHHVVAVLGALASSRSLAIAPIAQKSGIPMVTPTATHPQVTEQGDHIFRVCFVDPFQGSVMARFALESLKVKRIAIIKDVKSDYSAGLSDFFSKTLKEGGGEIVAQQSYASGDIDFKSQLTAIRAAQPQAIFVPGYYTEVGLIARQARELGLNVPLLGGDGWSSPKLKEIAGKAVENAYFSNHYSSSDRSEIVQSFIRDFQSNYHTIPDGIAALGYDAAAVLYDAIQRADSETPKNIRDALAKTKDFPGVTGKITFDDHRNPIKSAVILKIQNGEPGYYATIHP